MLLRNSTDIPPILVRYIYDYVRLPDVDDPELIHIKNKARGIYHGRYGWYYPKDKRVVLIVPPDFNGKVIREKMKYSKLYLEIRNRVEFVVAVMAHELRHHWQRETWEGWRLSQSRDGRWCREVDAETYEIMMLKRWRRDHK